MFDRIIGFSASDGFVMIALLNYERANLCFSSQGKYKVSKCVGSDEPFQVYLNQLFFSFLGI